MIRNLKYYGTAVREGFYSCYESYLEWKWIMRHESTLEDFQYFYYYLGRDTFDADDLLRNSL